MKGPGPEFGEGLPDAVVDALRGLASLGPSAEALACPDPVAVAATEAATARGYFVPEEEDRLRAWFARYLTTRAALRGTIEDLRPVALGRVRATERAELIAFATAYTAAALLVGMARCLLTTFPADSIARRKLDEACARHRIPRKQYTAIYRSVTHPRNAWHLRSAIEIANERREAIEALAHDPLLAPVVALLGRAAPALEMSVTEYLRARVRYRRFSSRRRGLSAAQRGLFALLEGGGRIVADVRNPFRRDRIRRIRRQKIAALLEPGDILVTRHDQALSNLFLPGYWPHAALYVGPAHVQQRLPASLPAERAARWFEPMRVLEARKDGVRLRALDDTLAVDAVAVIRPDLEEAMKLTAIANGLEHEGKGYNFDFDFFTSDRLVCTEVVYRAYQGVCGLHIPLASRGGRPTLSAEDLLRLAVAREGFSVVLVAGCPGARWRVLTGDRAHAALGRTLGG